MSREKWLSIRGNGGNKGKFYRSREREVHYSYTFTPQYDNVGELRSYKAHYHGSYKKAV